MEAMRGLTDDYKLSYRSIPEVWEAMNRLVTMVGVDKGIRYQRRYRAKQAAVMNAIICWIETQPERAKRAIIAEGMEALNRLLETEEATTQDVISDIQIRPAEPLEREQKRAAKQSRAREADARRRRKA